MFGSTRTSFQARQPFSRNETPYRNSTKNEAPWRNMIWALEISVCYGEVVEKWDKELNRAYNSLLKSKSKKVGKFIKSQQRNWLTFRDSYLKAFSESNDEGTISQIFFVRTKLDLIRTQVFHLYRISNPW